MKCVCSTTALAALTTLMTGLPRDAAAFDYLEHSFFTDRACLEAQLRLGKHLTASRTDPRQPEDPAPTARYLALALVCPERWERPYCSRGRKLLEANVNDLEEPPASTGELSITLGDFAALPDHLSQYGAVRGLPRAERQGLISSVLSWLVPNAGDPGGVISDVAEDACETDGLVHWDEVERDLAYASVAADRRARDGTSDGEVPGPLLTPLKRTPLQRGPADPAGPYSFDNPHYLDLILFNHHHFAEAAYGSYLGFHSAAITLAGQTCEEVLALDDDELEDIAEDGGGGQFAGVEWDDLPPTQLRARGCQLLADLVRQRLKRWARRADPLLVSPVRAVLARIDRNAPLARRVVVALMGTVLEGLGLHFLQDGLSAGHLRINRAAYGQSKARHMHNADSRQGVVATLGTALGERRFVAFGCSYLLGRAPVDMPGACTWDAAQSREPAGVSACLLRLQRGIVLQATTASLLDFSLTGPLYASPPRRVPATDRASLRFIETHLPTRAPRPTGQGDGTPPPLTLRHGTLPEPPPSFSYQSLSTALALDARDGATQTGVRLLFLSALGRRANWMTSYHFGFLSTARDKGRREAVTELSFMFHWRWAARFLVNAGPYVYIGAQGVGHDATGFAGLGPSVGFSLLPEGWINMPLELSVTYRAPLRLLDARRGLTSRAVRLEAHWVELSIGLVFL